MSLLGWILGWVAAHPVHPLDTPLTSTCLAAPEDFHYWEKSGIVIWAELSWTAQAELRARIRASFGSVAC